jgi:thioredoxin reductase (NADPH)
MEMFRSEMKKLKVFGRAESRDAYVIRDFLRRSVVTFEWVSVADIAAFGALFPELDISKKVLPAVELPSGKILFDPSVEDIARELGWISQPKLKEYDVSIFGGGPAGLSAAVYAASEGLKTVLIEREAIGGQAGTSSLIENYLGFPGGISGNDLAERARQQAVKFGVEILLIRRSMKAAFIDRKLHVDFTDGNKIIARSNISATGVEYARLDIPEEKKYINAGIYYGAGTSEAILCADRHVFVVGGGNSAGQAALNFSKHAKKVTMVIRGNDLAASLSYYLLNRITKTANIEVLFNTRMTSLSGNEFLEGITVTNSITQISTSFDTRYVFVCIGGQPNTSWAQDTPIVRDEAGYLVTGNDLFKPSFDGQWSQGFTPAFLETSVPGCFAAGDVRHNSVKRVASAVGEGAMAVTFVHRYLHETY